MAIAFVVFGVILYSIFSHRKSRSAELAHFHHSISTEIVWTTIPFVILIGMAIPSAKKVIRIENVSQPDMSVTTTYNQQHQPGSGIDAYTIEVFGAPNPNSNAPSKEDTAAGEPQTLEELILIERP